VPAPTDIQSINHRLPLETGAPPTAREMSIDGPMGIAREQAGWTHVDIFSFHANTRDIAMDLTSKFLGKIVLTNDNFDLAVHKRLRDPLDRNHRIVPKFPTCL
jgi:hypothetical protein